MALSDDEEDGERFIYIYIYIYVCVCVCVCVCVYVCVERERETIATSDEEARIARYIEIY